MRVTKPELRQISNYIGVIVGVVGNVLPSLTPTTLVALGVPPSKLQIASTLVAVLLVAYREKQPAAAVTFAVPLPLTPGDSQK